MYKYITPKKGNMIMGIIRRSYLHLTPKNFSLLFKALVRPHLEYGAVIWHPTLKKDMKTIEDVQRRGSRQVPELKGMTYPERLKKLEMPTLAYCRLRGDMVETYKITHGQYKIDQEQLLPKKRYTGNRGHSQRLEKTMESHHYSETEDLHPSRGFHMELPAGRSSECTISKQFQKQT